MTKEKIKIKMYNQWHEFDNKTKAIEKLFEYIEGSEGAERDRYMSALLAVKRGETSINTD